MHACGQIEAHARAGLAGDRYFDASLSDDKAQVTLLEEENVQAFNARHGATFPAGVFRRNVITRGIDLNPLIGRTFRIGDVSLRGCEYATPCAVLGKILSDGTGLTPADVVRQLLQRTGIRAQILASGTLAPGQSIEVLS